MPVLLLVFPWNGDWMGDMGEKGTLEDSYGSRVIVDAAGGAESSYDDRGRGHEIVGKGVV